MFYPNNVDNPIQIKYTTYTRRLSWNMALTETYNIENVILNDDQGVIFNTPLNKTKLSIFSKSSEYYFYTNEQLTTPSIPQFFYQANFYYSANHDYYTRTYTKLPNILASIGGFLEIVFLIQYIICMQVNHLNILDTIVMNMFSFDKAKKAIKLMRMTPIVSHSTLVNIHQNTKCNLNIQLNNSINPIIPIIEKSLSMSQVKVDKVKPSDVITYALRIKFHCCFRWYNRRKNEEQLKLYNYLYIQMKKKLI